MSTRILAVLNQKGGSGKTTTAVNLSAAFARVGHHVLLVDLDPQAHATVHLAIPVYELEHSIYDVLTQDVSANQASRDSGVPGLRILPSHLNLSGAELELSSAIGREAILRMRLQEVQPQYDIIVLDCPPTLGLLALNALCASTHLLIPVAAEFFALEGMTKLMRTVSIVQSRLGYQIEISGVLVTRYDARKKLCQDIVERAKSVPGVHVFETRIRENVRLAEAPSHGLDIFRYDVRSFGAEDYQALANEVLKS